MVSPKSYTGVVVAEEDIQFNNDLFSNHFLKSRIKNLDEWEETDVEHEYEAFVRLYREKRELLDNDLIERRTWSHFTGEIFERILGHYEPQDEPSKRVSGTNYEPDYTLFRNYDEFEEAQADDNEFEVCYGIVENKRWGRTLDKSTQDHDNPAFQIFNYIDRLRVPWGVLTNGKKWRLYSYEDNDADTYFEIDIEKAIIEPEREEALENFKYFYLFFRKEAFLPKGDSFLDRVLENSIRYAQQLEDDLEDQIYTALEVTARGFFDTNDLEKTEENREKVHEASLIFLYRILFILNAESRGLLPVEDEAYRQAFGLIGLKEMLDDDPEDNHLFQENTVAWDNRLSRLFEGIDEGYELDEEEIPAYNGGLFDEDDHPFLAENKLQGNYLRKVLELLAQSENEEGEKVLVDYQDLNIRHLGSVYEGLLEHKLEYAPERLILEEGEWKSEDNANESFEQVRDKKRVEEGEVYITNESGERKATGSYYTPEYIVEYIIEQTVGPQVQEKIQEADEGEVLNKVLELNICDPAMGSGHFLTEATSYMARKIMEEGSLEDKEVDEEKEFVWVKRQVVQSCIYGVDINHLATELAKLSLWIETMAEGKPLGFLDHHLKVGNSLVGADLDEIVFHPDAQREEKDLSNFNVMIDDMKEGLKAKYRKIERMPETTVNEVHEKEEKYREFKQDNSYYQSVNEFCNIYTYQHFEGDISPEQYGRVRDGIHNMSDFRDEDWFQEAQEDAEVDNRNYFHWALEFPKIFFGQDKGFDAVIGNPPWGADLSGVKGMLRHRFDTPEDNLNSFEPFLELAIRNTCEAGLQSYIIPKNFIKTEDYKYLRRRFLENYRIELLADAGECFEGVTQECLIEVVNKSDDFGEIELHPGFKNDPIRHLNNNCSGSSIQQESLSQDNYIWNLYTSDEIEQIKSKISTSDNTEELENLIEHHRGLEYGRNGSLVSCPECGRYTTPPKKKKDSKECSECGNDITKTEPDYYFIKEESDENHTEPLYTGGQIGRYSKEKPRYMDDSLEDVDYKEDYFFRGPKILMMKISSKIKASYDESDSYTTQSLYMLQSDDDESNLKSILGVLNSKMMEFFYEYEYNLGSNITTNVTFTNILELPIKQVDLESLNQKVETLQEKKDSLTRMNLDIRDYIGNPDFTVPLSEMSQPATEVRDTEIAETKEDKEKLRVGDVRVERHQDSVTVKLSARYKPENESQHDTDQYGYTETDFYPALEFQNLSEMEAALISEFVPVAVRKAGGYANFRENATNNKSLVDRLRALKLPEVDVIEDELRDFLQQKNEAHNLKGQIEEKNAEIDEIVYNLYDLTDAEIETVKEAT